MPRTRILIVDDDPGVRRALRRLLERRGHDVGEAASCQEAEAAVAGTAYDVVLLDQCLPDGEGVELMRRLHAVVPGVRTVVLTAHGSIDLAVRAVKEGADHFLTKPVDTDVLCVVIDRLLEQQRARRRLLAAGSRQPLDPFLGASACMRRLEQDAAQALQAQVPVLIVGETGTGKGVLARWLHDAGPRAEEAFVDFNCAGLSSELLDSELFGYEAGAFTGAQRAKPGLFEVAHRGTVFLDEIGDMAPTVQPRLLKVIEEKRFRRLGDVRDRHVDVRLVAATNQDLGALMRAGRFREDLYYRIRVLELRVPALRERPADVPLLAEHLLEGFSRELGRGRLELRPDALAAIGAYAWPGNVRELRNVLEGAALRCRAGAIGAADLRLDAAARGPEAAPVLLPLSVVEQQHIERTLAACEGRVADAARALEISVSSLYERLKRLGLPRGSKAYVAREPS